MMTTKKKALSTGSDWNLERLREYEYAIGCLAADFGLDTYPNQIEIISAEQMIDAYSSVGMPIGYHHWSFGKQFLSIEKEYRRGHMGLAYELVINANPCIAYLLEENSMAMQALVIAHACYGHNSFFKNNYLFKMWTSADAIIDYLVFARQFVSRCEEKHGLTEVEELLDACHALRNYGVDRYKHPKKLSLHEEKIRQANREHYLQSQLNELWRTIPKKQEKTPIEKSMHFPEEPQENLLYFIEKHAPLKPWQREVIRIVRKLAQYFYPQRQTKVMNEGWATFWHYTLLNALYDEGLATDEFMLEVLDHHSSVIEQPGFDSPHFHGLNPYTLGFKMFQDIRRICENPTEEDKEWFPYLVNSDWRKSLQTAMRDFKDESFIMQYLSPKLIRELKLFAILDDEMQSELLVSAIHNPSGYEHIRQCLAKQYDIHYSEPDIQVYRVDIEGNRSLTLHHKQYQQRPLDLLTTQQVIRYIQRLWQFPVTLVTVDSTGKALKSYHYPDTTPP